MGNAGSSGQAQPHPQQQGQLAAPPSGAQQRQMLQVSLPGHGAPTSAAATAQQAAAAPQPSQTPLTTQRYVGTDAANNRISVDIRSQHGDAAEWQVHVKRQDPEGSRLSRVESGVRGVSTTVQSVAGAVISVLMVAKLVEEILFVRKLRKELNSITAAIADPKSGGFEQGQPNQGRSNPAAKAGPGGSLDLVSMAGLAAAGTSSNADADAVSWEKIAGLHDVKMLLQEVTVLPTLRPDLFTGIRQPPRGVLLFGPPGSGKTLLARAVASESRSTFIPITGSSILSMWFGQSEQNVKALFERARRCQPAVIFIDEVDSLLGRRGSAGPAGSGAGGDSLPDKRVTNEFLSFIDGIQTNGTGDCRITLMAATNTPWDLDEAALSRFARRIYVPLPDKDTRAQLVKQAMRGVACDLHADEYSQLAERVGQYSGRDLVSVCREAAMQPVRELWGDRLLAGGQEGDKLAARQRLVLVVAEQLKKGQPAKRIKRELEAYRKRMEKDSSTTGAAAPEWLDVDDVMKRAQQMADSGKNSAAGGAGAAAGANAAQAAACVSAGAGVEQLAGQTKASSSGVSLPSAGVDATDAHGTAKEECSSVRGAAAGAAGDVCGGEQAEPGSAEASAVTGSALASSASSSRTASIGRPSSDDGAAVQASSDSTPSGREQAGARAGGTDEARSVDCVTSSSGRADVTPAAPAAPRGPSTANVTRKGKGKSRGEGGANGAGKGGSGALSMQALLSLPSDQLRPVRFSDFERALSLISPSDFEGMTMRYEEWNGQYGSGADSKGRERTNKAFYSMYV